MDASELDVLIVDDDPVIADGLVEYFTRSKLKCRAVNDPWEALKILTGKGKATVVVCDIRMPELSGLQFAEHLQVVDPDRRPELIFISGHAGFDDAVAAIRVGARDLLTKPVEPAALARAVKSAILVSNLKHKSGAETPPVQPGAPIAASRRATARNMQAVRKIRSKYFPSDLFSDPCWEMLLDLYEGALAGKPMSVTNLTVGSSASATTAWRRLVSLEEHQLVERDEDPEDKRRAIVKLTHSGRKAVENFFDTYSGHIATVQA